MSNGPYYVGGSAVSTIIFSDPTRPLPAGNPAADPQTGYQMVNPTTVSCVLRKPDNTEVALAVTPNGFQYSAVSPVFDQVGSYAFGWSATGSYNDYKEDVIYVQAKRT